MRDFDYLGKHILLPPQQKPPSTFFSLPRALRDCIYDYYFLYSFNSTTTTNPAGSESESNKEQQPAYSTRKIILTSAAAYNRHIQLLFTTRQIHAEAREIYYNSHQFRELFFAPESPRAAYALITSPAFAHGFVGLWTGQVRVQPRYHCSTGLGVASGYRSLDDGVFVSVEFLELGLAGCERVDLLDTAAAATGSGGKDKDMENSEWYLCGMDWRLRIAAPQTQEGGLLLTGHIGVLSCLCAETNSGKSLPKLSIRVKRRMLKNIGSRFREIA